MPKNTKVITGGRRIELRGSLPGEHATKGGSISVPVIACDGKHRKEIVLTRKIGAGGEGSVFETNVGRDSAYVAKIYRRDKLTEIKCAKTELMIAKGIECQGICFPVALIKNEKEESVGFLMPRAKGYELGKSVFLPKLLQARFPQWTRKDTIQLCLTILHKIKYLNDRGIILGDINGQNILVASPTEVYFVDCDSYQIGNYPCPAGTAHFTPPEAQGRSYETFLRTQAMENFAIATLLFMIMLPGKSPYSAVGGADPAENIRQGSFPYESDDNSKVPPGKWGFIWSHMSYNTRQAFVETFRKGGGYFEPEKRMNADGWIEVFEKYWYGTGHMLENDPMAMDLFPTRPKMRECKKCGKRYVPKPNRHAPLCDDCYGESSAGRRESHEKWLAEVWKSYPCKNPKCHNTITLYNRDQGRYQNKRLPEYCQACWQDMPCRKCGYVAAKWMHDERGGLCRRCYEEEQRENRLKQQRAAAQPSMPDVKTASTPSLGKSQENSSEGCLSDGLKCIGICLFLLLLYYCFFA